MFSDSHCHLDFTEFDLNREELINACSEAGVKRFLVPAVEQKNWQRVIDLSSNFQGAKAACGIHPWYLEQASDEHLEQLDRLFNSELKLAAVGEIGLDWAIDTAQELQLHFFTEQLTIAVKYNKPAIIHSRRSHDQVAQQLRITSVDKGGVIHGFSGSYQQAKNFVDLGFKIGVGGTITYPRAEKTIKALKRLPLTSLLLETDAPAMPLHGQQGNPNSPLNIPLIFDRLVELRSESREEIMEVIEDNFTQLFVTP